MADNRCWLCEKTDNAIDMRLLIRQEFELTLCQPCHVEIELHPALYLKLIRMEKHLANLTDKHNQLVSDHETTKRLAYTLGELEGITP